GVPGARVNGAGGCRSASATSGGAASCATATPRTTVVSTAAPATPPYWMKKPRPNASAVAPWGTVTSPASGGISRRRVASRPNRTPPHFAAMRTSPKSRAATKSHAVGSVSTAPVAIRKMAVRGSGRGKAAVPRERQGDRERAGDGFGHGRAPDASGHQSAEPQSPGNQRGGSGSRRGRDGRQREDCRHARRPGRAQRRDEPGEQAGSERHRREGARRRQRGEQPDVSRNTPHVAPFETGAERRADPAERERGDRGERTEQRRAHEADARPQHQARHDEQTARREQRVQARHATPRGAWQAGCEQANRGESREREHGTHVHARTFARARRRHKATSSLASR